jgi:GTP-binding protein Era
VIETPVSPSFRAGLAVLVGRTNAGKSTLLNALVGKKISIVTHRPQTTRHPVHGIVHRPEGQVVFVDTPGFFKTHKSALVDTLHQRASEALKGIDAVVHVVDPTRDVGEESDMVAAVLGRVEQPKILCLSKLDLPKRPFREDWLRLGTGYSAVVEASGFTGDGCDALVTALMALMPVGLPLYPPDQLTNTTLDFRVAEMIREKVYLYTGEEVPYRTQVEVDKVEELPSITGKPVLHVTAAVVTPTDGYQRMLIGAGARKIKQIRLAAQDDLRRLLGMRVKLELDVIVDRNMEH